MSEPRWVAQTNNYSCGPIVVANTLKWSGVGYNWGRDKDSLRKLCRTTKEMGTHERHLEAALRTLGSAAMIIKRRKKWKLAEIIDHVESRGCVIFDHTSPLRHNMSRGNDRREAHYTICVDVMGEGQDTWFKMINFSRGETISWISRSHFRWTFMHRRYDDRVWFVRLRD